MEPTLYIKVGDNFLPYDESSMATVSVSFPGENVNHVGQLTTESARELLPTLIGLSERKKPGRKSK